MRFGSNPDPEKHLNYICPQYWDTSRNLSLDYKNTSWDRDNIVLDPKTTLTLGTGKKFNNLVLDFAMNYNMISYMHHDIFPMMNTSNLSCDDVGCDTVRENNLTLQATVRYDF